MGDLTENLSRHEYACKCNYPECKRTPVDHELVNATQKAVDHFYKKEKVVNEELIRVSCIINSGFRCERHNRDVGGSETSTHMLGMGEDLRMVYVYTHNLRIPVPDDDVADYFEKKYPDKHGVVRYIGRTHFDTRPDFYRGDKR